VQVTLVKPGPTQTPMTAKMDGHEKMAPVEDVASCIVNGVRREKSTIYAPTKWALIMLIIKHLPRFIFNRMKI
jgi:short-subunit dehydrogenase